MGSLSGLVKKSPLAQASANAINPVFANVHEHVSPSFTSPEVLCAHPPVVIPTEVRRLDSVSTEMPI